MGAAVTVKNLIISGSPGVGKTTLIKECTLPYREAVGGFFTEEIREGSERKGFLLKTFNGASGVLAQKGLKSSAKLNKYGVDLKVLEETGVASVRRAMDDRKIVVVDEIGSMEMMSPAFCEIIAEALAGTKPLLATIRLKAEPFSSQIKKMSNTKLMVLKKENFLEVKNEVRAWLEDLTAA